MWLFGWLICVWWSFGWLMCVWWSVGWLVCHWSFGWLMCVRWSFGWLLCLLIIWLTCVCGDQLVDLCATDHLVGLCVSGDHLVDLHDRWSCDCLICDCLSFEGLYILKELFVHAGTNGQPRPEGRRHGFLPQQVIRKLPRPNETKLRQIHRKSTMPFFSRGGDGKICRTNQCVTCCHKL